MNIKIYEVGGAVRDKLMGLEPKDIDYAVEAPSWDAMREEIIRRGGTIFLETPQYFTIRAKVPDIGAADFVLCRKDGVYKDGRHPESVEVGTIFDDLSRRDFRINAMARDIVTNELLDPFEGQYDIEHSLLNFVGDADTRLSEDVLRAYRALRFLVTKSLILTGKAREAIGRVKIASFENVSTERIREELNKMFRHNTLFSFQLLFREFPGLGELALDRGIWFEPTTKAK